MPGFQRKAGIRSLSDPHFPSWSELVSKVYFGKLVAEGVGRRTRILFLFYSLKGIAIGAGATAVGLGSTLSVRRKTGMYSHGEGEGGWKTMKRRHQARGVLARTTWQDSCHRQAR